MHKDFWWTKAYQIALAFFQGKSRDINFLKFLNRLKESDREKIPNPDSTQSFTNVTLQNSQALSSEFQINKSFSRNDITQKSVLSFRLTTKVFALFYFYVFLFTE